MRTFLARVRGWLPPLDSTLEVVGVASIATGAGVLHLAAGLIVAGAGMIWIAQGVGSSS